MENVTTERLVIRRLSQADLRDFVTAGCDTRNVASFRLMKRLGVRREGHLQQSQRGNGLWRDEYLYALLCEEWLAGARAEAGHEPVE